MARIVYGKRPVEEALRHRPGDVARLLLDQTKRQALTEFADEAAAAEIAVEWTTRQALDKLCDAQSHQGLVAEVREFDYTSVKAFIQQKQPGPRVVVALDGVTDPQNFGSCLRAAGAFGADLVVTTKRRGCPVTSTVVRVSAGGTEVVAIARESNLTAALEQLQQAGFWVYGLAADGERTLAEIDLSGDVVLVLGSEGEGLHKRVADTCDALARIVTPGPLDSLNVAQAATVALYEVFRQRTSV